MSRDVRFGGQEVRRGFVGEPEDGASQPTAGGVLPVGGGFGLGGDPGEWLKGIQITK